MKENFENIHEVVGSTHFTLKKFWPTKHFCQTFSQFRPIRHHWIGNLMLIKKSLLDLHISGNKVQKIQSN